MSNSYTKTGKGKIIVPEGFIWPRPPWVYINVSGSNVIIEKDVTFSSGINIITHSHKFDKSDWRDLPKIIDGNPTIFKTKCFIGMNSIILYKCKIIGECSVIGAGSVVNNNIPDYEIWAGNPAKKIGEVEKI